ncbi:unnamed protein product [Rotaria sordida]|uniref:F-box domain-containing protein n=1 Tax=Rotaria sordida TaxID=392033 RepID=A0A814UF83_9BILA|nr:unnamed protein product [Rotaria sordida]
MATSCSQSTLEMLPDEILLEICKYLLCADILMSLIGLNYRITQMITNYRHHISLHKTSISKSDYLCINILPQIGSQIRTLLIDCCYSILQDDLFIEHFGKKMSIIFPKLERISLVSYEYNQLIAFIDTLHDFNYLVEIRLYSLFSIHVDNQSTVIRSLSQANNHRLTTILIDDRSSPLHFHHTDCYSNTIRLRITLRTSADLPSLFHAVPNVRYLDVELSESDDSLEYFGGLNLSPLFHLTYFQFKSIQQSWMLEELLILFAQLPIVRHLSLFLLTTDRRLIEGGTILPSLPFCAQQFDYAICFFDNMFVDQIDAIIASWSPSHRVTCFYQNPFLFIHTLPWHLARISFPELITKMISCRSLGIISKCRQVREITFSVKDTGEIVEEEQCPILHIPKLSRLIQVNFYGSIPSDLNHFSFILNAAPNLFRLDLPFDYLWLFIENQQIRHLLDHRITSLSIFKNSTKSSSITLNEEHISIIASTFFRVQDLYVDLTHLQDSTTIVSNDNILEDSTVRSLSVQSCQEKYEVTSSGSSESMVVRLLVEFQEHKLVSLCITGLFFEKIKTDVKQWLQCNTVLCEQQFEAVYSNELHRLLIWM